MIKTLKKILILLIAAAALLSLSVSAYAAGSIDTETEVDLTVYFRKGEDGFPDVTYRIYKVADIDSDCRFYVTDAFRPYVSSLNGLDQDGWRELARTLSVYAADMECFASAKTNEKGAVRFDLMPALYLVTAEDYSSKGYIYKPVPFIILLPEQDPTTGEWKYNGCEAYQKYDFEEELIDISVRKLWDDEGYEDKRPGSVKVILYRDGEPYDTVTLSGLNGWKYLWSDLSTAYEWTLDEEVPENYTKEIIRVGNDYTVVNKYTPGTGDTFEAGRWTVMFTVSLLGLLLMMRRRRRYSDE